MTLIFFKEIKTFAFPLVDQDFCYNEKVNFIKQHKGLHDI
jgi:hypothetical protein